MKKSNKMSKPQSKNKKKKERLKCKVIKKQLNKTGLVKIKCPICFESTDCISSTICGHVFCTRCIQNTELLNHKCPICHSDGYSIMVSLKGADQGSIKTTMTSDKKLIDYSEMVPKLDDPDWIYSYHVKNLAKLHFELKAISHDILLCTDSIENLDKLNEMGRGVIRLIREDMEKLDHCVKDLRDPKFSKELETQRHLLAGVLKEFKEANIRSLFTIEKSQRQELLTLDEGKSGVKVRQRKVKVDGDGLLQMSTGVTDQLLSISRQLADTTQRSQDTLDSLVSSSSSVHGTQSELQNTAGTISQSSKLLNKYGRREFTDKVIMFFAFLFFLAVCLYIVQKRMF